jgi:REP element-mobilizing transposase RayT
VAILDSDRFDLTDQSQCKTIGTLPTFGMLIAPFSTRMQFELLTARKLSLCSRWKEFPQLKHQFWKDKTCWSDGYFVCSVGNASAETIRKYIQEQG